MDEIQADRLMEQARVEFDPARRAALCHQLHALLARDQPYLWMVQVASKWAMRRRVQNVHASHGVGLFHHYPGPFAWRIECAVKCARAAPAFGLRGSSGPSPPELSYRMKL